MSFFGELRRRNVVKVAVAYAIVGWLLMEVASVMAPALNLPEWSASFVAFVLILGFPVALVLSWAYELTPDGMKKTRSVPLSESITQVTGQKLNYVVTGLLTIAVLFLVLENYVLRDPMTAAVVEESEADLAPASADPVPAITEQRDALPNSVAVLPFDNLSPDPQNAYFAAGIHEEVLNALAKLQNLSVISRTSVVRYADSDLSIPEIAEELNVQSVMEGSVRYAGDRVRITAQLINAATDEHLWSEVYERDFADYFAIQADIAMNIANAMEVEFSTDEQQRIESVPTDSPAAHALYLSALTRGGGVQGVTLAIADLDAALALDPQFALAYAQRAWNYAAALLFSEEVPAEEYERNAIASAEQALNLDPSIGLAHSVLATIDGLNGRWAAARRNAERAYELSPHDVGVLLQYARLTRSNGEYAESVRVIEEWDRIAPNNANLYQQLAVTHRYAGNYDAAAAAARRAIELFPAGGSYHLHLAHAEAARGNTEVALSELQVAEDLFGGNFDQVFRVGQMAMAYSLLDRRADVQRMLTLLEELERDGTAVGEAIRAQVHIALGDYDEALELLEAAMARGASVDYTTLIEIKANPWALPELNTPRFQDVLSSLWAIE